jgi:hypothetical protein
LEGYIDQWFEEKIIMADHSCGSNCDGHGHSHGDNSKKNAEMDIFKAAKSG